MGSTGWLWDRASRHVLGEEPPPSTCGEWGKTLRSPSEAHQKSQARKTPYTCSECGKAFGRSAHLAQHRVMHRGPSPTHAWSVAKPSAGSPT